MTLATMSIAKQCDATKRDGQRCRAPVQSEAPYCYTHDPARAVERDAARRAGGRNRANAVRLRALVPPRLSPIFDRLESALARVDCGELDPRQAAAMASLARALVSVLQAGELEARVRELEERHAADARRAMG